jgi:hypothetical protein
VRGERGEGTGESGEVSAYTTYILAPSTSCAAVFALNASTAPARSTMDADLTGSLLRNLAKRFIEDEYEMRISML